MTAPDRNGERNGAASERTILATTGRQARRGPFGPGGGKSGRRLSSVESWVTGVHCQVWPPLAVTPRKISWWRTLSVALTSGAPVVGLALVEMNTTLGSLGSKEPRPL